MSIAIQSSDELEELRKLLRKMSDDVLVSFGKAARSLYRNRDCPDTFKRQLDEARAELAAFNYRDSMATGVVPPHGRSKVWLGWQYTNNWDLALLFGNIGQSKSCRVSLLWRKRQQLNSTVSFACSQTLDFHLYLPFQQLAAMSWWAGLARRLHLRLGESATNGTLRRVVTKRCKGRDPQAT